MSKTVDDQQVSDQCGYDWSVDTGNFFISPLNCLVDQMQAAVHRINNQQEYEPNDIWRGQQSLINSDLI
jgi:hypothetical protein